MVPPLGGSEDRRDVILASRGGGMGVVICDGGLGGGRSVANEGVHLEAAGYHRRTYRKFPCFELCTGAEQITGLNRFMRWWYQDLNREEEADWRQ